MSFPGRAVAGTLLLALTGLLGGTAATVVAGPAVAAPSPLGTADESYLTAAAQTNLAELAMAHVAQRRSGSSAVREVANTIVDDHTHAQELLRTVAAKVGVAPPARPNPAQRVQLSELRSAPAAAFDPMYLSMQINDHAVAIGATRAEIGGGTNAAVVGYARAVLPALRKHLHLARTAEPHRSGASRVQPSTGPSALGPHSPAAAKASDRSLVQRASGGGSADGPWLIALGAVVALGIVGGLLLLRNAAGRNR